MVRTRGDRSSVAKSPVVKKCNFRFDETVLATLRPARGWSVSSSSSMSVGAGQRHHQAVIGRSRVIVTILPGVEES